MSVHAIIVAAGKGRRFGGLKQFYLIRGRPLFLYAVRAFEANKKINKITVVVPRNSINRTIQLIKNFEFSKTKYVVAGGKRRQDSVLNGLRTIKDGAGLVIIHDGARPNIAQQTIEKGIKLCRKYKAVICGIEVCDTLKEAKSGFVQNTISRRGLFLIQTPQFFDLGLIKNVFKKADLNREYTDEASLVESLRIPVYLFRGDRTNIKVTQRGDLKLVEKFLA